MSKYHMLIKEAPVSCDKWTRLRVAKMNLMNLLIMAWWRTVVSQIWEIIGSGDGPMFEES